MIEELARLILEADAKGFADAKAQIAAVEAELAQLNRDYQSGAASIEEYYSEGRKIQGQLDQLKSAYAVADASVKKYGSSQAAAAAMAEKAHQRSTVATRGASQAAIELSRGLEDLSTGGFLGVLNNIPRMFEGIGASAGMSAAQVASLSTGISLLATGLFVVYQNWDTIMGLFGEATQKGLDSIGLLKERIKELEEKDVKLGIDIAELDEAKRKLKELEDGAKAFRAAAEGKTVWEKEAGKQAEEMFDVAGPEFAQAQAAMVDVKAAELAGRDAAYRKALKEKEVAEAGIKSLEEQIRESPQDAADLRLAIEAQQGIVAEAEKEMSTAVAVVRENAKALIGKLKVEVEAGNRPGARGELAGRLRQVGATAMASDVESITPESVQAGEEEEAAWNKRMERAKEASAAKAKRLKKIQEAREKAGREAEQDPEGKRLQAEIDKRFGGFGREGVSLEDAAAAARRAQAKDHGKDKQAQRLPKRPDRQQQQKLREERYTEGLARDIHGEMGGQFTPEQSRAAARRSLELQKEGVNAGMATQAAMAEGMQAMMEMSAQLRQQIANAHRMAQGFAMMRRQMAIPGPTNLPMGGQ